MKFKLKEFTHELKHHLPFTAIATAIAIVIAIFFVYFFKQNVSEIVFEILHPLHIIASAIVTSAIMYKYKKNIIQAILIGTIGAILIGSISDIILPYLGGELLSLQMYFHLPLIETPLIIIFCSLIGALLGILTGLTKLPHTIHIGLSVFTSIFYILAFSSNFPLIYILGIFIIIMIAVIVPCSTSDILLPFFFLGKRIKTCDCRC